MINAAPEHIIPLALGLSFAALVLAIWCLIATYRTKP